MNLTKKVNIEPGALLTIAEMQWSSDGDKTVGKLPDVQLDRKAYTEVNKGLAAMGGKWNRKIGGHLFDIDPREQIEELLKTGHVVVERDGFFRTPEDVVLKMMDMCEMKVPILEPSAGDGAICDVLVRETGYKNLDVIEINPSRQSILLQKEYTIVAADFMSFDDQYSTIIMNPPFEVGQDIIHVTHAFKNCLEMEGELVAIMSEGVFHRRDKQAAAFRELVDRFGYSKQLPEGSFKDSGTMVNTRLVYLTKSE